jgi:hypothetical protein
MPLQLTDKITYGYPVDGMLNSTERITDKLKWLIFFFGAHGPFIKPSVNLLTTNLLTDQKLLTSVFFMDGFHL